MSPEKKLQVSAAELDVLRALWDAGPATLREVHRQLADRHAYTTVQTMLDRLVQKGLVRRQAKSRPARYKAKVTRDRVVQHYLGLMLDKVCEGPAPLVLQLLKDERFSPEELAQIERLIEQTKPSSKGESDDRS